MVTKILSGERGLFERAGGEPLSFILYLLSFILYPWRRIRCVDAHLGSHDDIIWRFPPVPHKEKVLNDAIGQAFQFIFTTGVLRTFAYTRVYAYIRVYAVLRTAYYATRIFAYWFLRDERISRAYTRIRHARTAYTRVYVRIRHARGVYAVL